MIEYGDLQPLQPVCTCGHILPQHDNGHCCGIGRVGGLRFNCSCRTFVSLAPSPVDSVNHPSHYTSYKGIEVIQLTEQMNFNRGNAVKYIARAGLKGPETELEDLKKALWYINREIERITDDRG